MSGLKLLGPDGNPLPTTQTRPSRASMLAGRHNRVPYDAASYDAPHFEDWNPYLGSPDMEINPWRDRVVSRMRDQVRNDGWSSGIVTRILDNALGAYFRPLFKPHFTALAHYTGNPAFDAVWAREYAKALKARFQIWAEDIGRYNDSERRRTFSQQMGLAFRHKVVENDALAVLYWHDDRIGLGAAHYATAVQIVDPDRLSNPANRFDDLNCRGGVQLDDWQVATGYHIRRAHQSDWWAGADTVSWDFLPRETEWGRPVVVHDFEADRAGQHRGGVGVLGPVLQRLKMLFRYDTAELDAALINAVLGAYVESPFDHDMLGDALNTDDDRLSGYQSMRADFHSERRLGLAHAKVSMLFPGEQIKFAKSERPNGNFAAFEKAVLRNAASAGGVSAQQASNDWSDVNYSSARAALMEFWKTNVRRRENFGSGFAHPIVSAWQEESHEVDDLPLPAGAPPFIECRAAYSRMKFLGPGIGWLNPIDEPAGAILEMEGCLSTLEEELAEQGKDIDEVLDARQLELAEFDARGMPRPSWAAANQVRQDTRKDRKDDE